MSFTINNISEFTNYWRQAYPTIYQNMDDESIINLVKRRHPEIEIPEYEEVLQTAEDSPLTQQPQYKDYSLENTETDPQSIASWFLTSDFIPESFKEEGFMGISPEFFREAYNNSMAGTAYKALHGKDYWEVDDYDPAWYSQMGQFIVGMASPLELGTILFTGAIGKGTSALFKNTIFGGRLLEKGVATSIASKYPKMGTLAQNTLDGALTTGIGGSGYAAAHALTQNVAQQRMLVGDAEGRGIGKINVRDALTAASDEFLHSLPVFATAGGLTHGMMASIYGYAGAYMAEGTLGKKLTQAVTNPTARYGSESLMFTTLPAMMGDEDAPKLGTPEWWQNLGTDLVLAAGLRLGGKMVEGKDIDAYRFLSNEIKLENKLNKNINKSVSSVINEIDSKDVPLELRNMVKKSIIDEAGIDSNLSQGKKDLDFIAEINRKLEDTDYQNKARTKGTPENIEMGKYAQLVSTYKLGEIQTIANILSGGEPRIKQSFKDYYGKEPNATELTRFTKTLENWQKDLQESINWHNEYISGGWTLNDADGVSGGQVKNPSNVIPDYKIKTQLGGMSRADALKGMMTEKEIIKRAKKAGFEEGVEYKLDNDGKIIEKNNLINRLYDLRKYTEETKRKELELSQEQLRAASRGANEYTEIENIILKEKINEKSTSSIPEVQASNISNENKNIISYSLDRLRKKKKSAASAKETIELAEFVENRYKRNLHQLTADELASLGVEYIQDKLGVDIYDLTNQELINKKFTDRQIRNLKRKADSSRDNLNELFKNTPLGRIVGDNIVADIKKWNVKSVEKLTIIGGRKGFQKWINFIKSKKNIEYIPERIDKRVKKTKKVLEPAQTISSTGAELAIKLANQGRLRPTELVNLKVTDLLTNAEGKLTGEIRIFQAKQKGGGERVRIIDDLDLSKKLLNYAKNNNKSGTDKVFPFEKAAKFNALAKYLSEKSGARVQVRYEGKVYEFGDVLAPTERVGKLDIPEKIAGSGREYGRALRARFDSEKPTGTSQRGISDAAEKQYDVAATKEKRAQRLKEEVIFKTKGDDVARTKFINKVLKKNKLTKEQLKVEGLKEGVLGEFAEGMIKLQEGLWQPADFYHENLHRLKAFGRATNNTKLNKLIDKAEKLAVNTKEYKAWKKKNPNRDVEEFLADIAGGKASRMEFSSGAINKMKQFLKQIVSRVKVAFGVGNFKDISNVLAKRVQKGFSTEGVEFAKGQIKFRMEEMTQDGAYKYAKNALDELFDVGELSKGQKSDVVRFIGEMSGFGEDFKLNKNVEIPQLQQFVATINSMDKNVIKRLPDKVEKFRLFRDSERQRIVKNVKESERAELLKDLNVKDGELLNATNAQIKDYMEILATMDDVSSPNSSYIDDQISNNAITIKTDRMQAMKNLVAKNTKFMLPVSTVLESIGFKKLANKLYSHTSQELKHIGAFSAFEDKMQGLLGQRKWNKTKEMLYLFDKERYMERKDLGVLSNSEKKFINDAIDIDTWKVKNTEAGEIVKEYNKLMKYYKDELVGDFGVLRQVLNDAEFEKFVNDKNIKWLEENIYVQRRLTKEFKELYDPNARHFENLIEQQTEAIATKMAKRYYKDRGTKNVTPEMISNKKIELWDDANATAYGELYDMFDFNPGKYTPSFLKERHVKLPEFIEIGGKKVEVYEKRFGLTVKDYAVGQAKFLANVEYFPEFVKMKGFNKVGEKKLLGELRIKDKGMSDWVEKRIKDHLKIDKSYTDYPSGIRLTRYTTSTLAKIGLSMPTSGIKNFLVGSTQSLLTFRLRDFGMSFVDALYKDNRRMVKATGATEIGMRDFEMKGFKGLIDKAANQPFKAGLMKPSENINRYVSVLAGRRDQAYLVRRLQNAKLNSSSYKKAYTKLSKFYKLDDSEIGLLKKFGMNGVEGMSKVEKLANKRALDAVYQKLDTYAHINTQGAAINIFMPDWAGGPLAQSALLYKRMAFAATTNTMRNLSIAVQTGTMLRPLMFGLGTYLSGEAMVYLYDAMYGQKLPKQNSDEWNYYKLIMWKGEFLGILSEFLNPFRQNGGYAETMYPAVASTISTMANSSMSIMKGEKFAGQGAHDIFKSSVSLYNGVSKIYKQHVSKEGSYAQKEKNVRNLFSEMGQDIQDREFIEGTNKFKINFERSKYMRAFHEAFTSHEPKDVAKWYMMAVFAKANDYWFTKQLEDGTPITTEKEAMQYAWDSLSQSLDTLNPDRVAVTATTKKGKRNQILKRIQAHDWFKAKDKEKGEEFIKMIENTTGQYWEKRKLLMQELKKYLQSTKLQNDLKYYNIKFESIFFKK